MDMRETIKGTNQGAQHNEITINENIRIAMTEIHAVMSKQSNYLHHLLAQPCELQARRDYFSTPDVITW